MSFVEFGWSASDFLFPLFGYLVRYYPDEWIWLGQGVISVVFAIIWYWRMPTKGRRRTTTELSSLLWESDNQPNPVVNCWRLFWNLSKNERFVALMSFGFFQTLGS